MNATDLGHGRGWLTAGAVASIHRIDREIGHPLQITSAGRTWAEQNEAWQRYQRYGYPIALHPDTPSIHQLGNAIDTDERITAVLNRHGWFHTVYRNGELIEPWHYEYTAAKDQHRNNTTQEDTMDELIEINGKVYLLTDGSVKHCESPAHVEEIKRRTGIPHTKLDGKNKLDEWARALDMHGVPRGVINGDGLVKNPQSGKFEHGALWNWARAVLARS